MNYVEINPSVYEQTWANNSTGSSGRLPATAFGFPPSDDGPIHEGSEWDDSEVGTNDPVVDPDTLETMSRRRRRRRAKQIADDAISTGNNLGQQNSCLQRVLSLSLISTFATRPIEAFKILVFTI